MSDENQTEQVEQAAPAIPVVAAASLWEAYAVDTSAEENGVWVNEFRGTAAEFRIRSNESKVVRAVRERVDKRNLKYLAHSQAIPAHVKELNAKELAVAAVADWRGVTDEKGTPLVCTPQNALYLFGHPAMRELRDQIVQASASGDTFRAAELKAASGN